MKNCDRLDPTKHAMTEKKNSRNSIRTYDGGGGELILRCDGGGCGFGLALPAAANCTTDGRLPPESPGRQSDSLKSGSAVGRSDAGALDVFGEGLVEWGWDMTTRFRKSWIWI